MLKVGTTEVETTGETDGELVVLKVSPTNKGSGDGMNTEGVRVDETEKVIVPN